MREAVTYEAYKATPPVVVATATGLGQLTLNEWVAIATLTYIALQTIYLIHKWYKETFVRIKK